MRAAVFDEFGGPAVLRITDDAPMPEPGAGEVRIAVRAAGLNHLDLWLRRGLPIETTMPHIGGSDVAGIVEGVGPGVDSALVGMRVVLDPSRACGECEWCRRGEAPLCDRYQIIGEHTQGGFAEFVVAPAANLYRIPDRFDFETAAAAPLVFLTAWRGLVTRARLKQGETVLITGASGGVSTAAIQIAKHMGAYVYAVTTAEHVEQVRRLGADVVFDRETVDFSKEIWKATNRRGVDVILDSVGSATWKQNLRALAKLGRIVVYGATTGPIAETDLRLVFWKQLEIIGTTMATPAEFREVMDLVFSGVLKPVVDSVLPLNEIRTAHERLEAGDHFGKIVLVP